MNRIIILIISFFASIAAVAVDKTNRQINTIKMDTAYLYGEATMPTQEKAMSLAYKMLQEEVEKWIKIDSLKIDATSIGDINNLADNIITQRAEMFRVFAYIKKTDILSTKEQGEIPKDSLNGVDSIMAHKDGFVTDEIKRTIKQHFLGRKQNDALYHLKQARTFFELKEIMQPLKEKGDILDYGKYATAEHPEECYLIIYDPAGNIKALLGKGKENRTNLKTGHDDNIRNYRGCGAIWFTLNEK